MKKALWLLFITIVLGLLKQRKAEHEPISESPPCDKQDQTTNKEHPEINFPQALPADYIAREEKWHSEQRQNWRSQLWPQWVLAGTAIIASAVGLVTLNLVRSTVNITRDQLHISDRPWVGIIGPVIIAKPLRFDTDGGELIIKALMKILETLRRSLPSRLRTRL